MKKIAIYQDFVHNNSALMRAVASWAGGAQCVEMDSDALLAGHLNNEFAAFIMPGGASRYVAAKLNGAGNDAIRRYVAEGGLYIGICAGAYYACRRIVWQPDFDQKFTENGELGFFNGTATGPIHAYVAADNPRHMATRATLQEDTGDTRHGFYWGGPLFIPADDQKEHTILARYADLSDTPAAVIAGTYQNGRYMLCSPHLEIDTAQLQRMTFDVVDNRYADIAAMTDQSGLTLDYFHALLTRFIA